MEKAAFRQLEEGAADLRRLMSSTGRSGVEVAAALCRGRSYVEIIRHARSVGSDLIVLGRHGRRGLRDIFIGSTAARVSRMAGVPVLVVGRKANRPYERVVIAVDLEDTSRAVVEAALCVSGPDVRAVTMLHAYHVPFEDLIFPNVSRTRMTGLRKECRQTAASGMSRLQSSLGDAGVLWRTRVVHGDARAAILMETIKRRADFVAVGTHGRSGLSHSLVGSVAESVIEAAACDVLVARPVRMSFELP